MVIRQGFPKSLDIGKAIDKAAGAEREVVGRYQPPGMEKPWNLRNAKDERTVELFASSRNNLDITAPATDAAKQWQGWGTALKPAWEPIVLGMNPLDGTFAANAEKHGVAGLNINGCRITRQRTSMAVLMRPTEHPATMDGGCNGAALVNTNSPPAGFLQISYWIKKAPSNWMTRLGRLPVE